MSKECQDCKHSRLWTYEEKLKHHKRMVDLGIIPCSADHYICDKIPEGRRWIEQTTGKTYTYDGYSLKGECYDDVFGCFEEENS